MGFPRQRYWSGLPFPSPEEVPDPGIEPGAPVLQQTLPGAPVLQQTLPGAPVLQQTLPGAPVLQQTLNHLSHLGSLSSTRASLLEGKQPNQLPLNSFHPLTIY